MCGIVGLCLRNGGINEDEIGVLRDSMEHRGPDDAGFWMDPQRRIGLAHRRLSVIDLSTAGHQPMQNEDGSIILVFNGEIYNFRELREQLKEKGHVFRSTSDSEVIIRSYEEWGDRGIGKLNGMFAFAILDRRCRRLVLARDRFGEKPLYYYREGDTLLFASELKAIEAYPSFPRRVRHDLLSRYFTFGNIPSPDSIYQSVFKLPPAHYMVVDTESFECSIESYWQGMETALGGATSTDDFETIVSRTERDLSDSINMRLVADVPVGAFLSGGVDSSLVVSIASRLKADLKTFSIGFKDAEHDEAPYARAIADHLGCDHFEHYISEGLCCTNQ
jgi:asparagine synthase (glutamine-hydrolysing)